MVKLELLSQNLLTIMNQIILNDKTVKYLYYNDKDVNPLTQPSLQDNSVLFENNIFPAPFDPELTIEDCSQLRIYYFGGKLSKAVEQPRVIFDIIVAKSLWLMNDGTPSVRPYSIMREVVNDLDDVSIDTVGRLHFTDFNHIPVNKQFDGIRLLAHMTTFNSG